MPKWHVLGGISYPPPPLLGQKKKITQVEKNLQLQKSTQNVNLPFILVLNPPSPVEDFCVQDQPLQSETKGHLQQMKYLFLGLYLPLTDGGPS